MRRFHGALTALALAALAGPAGAAEITRVATSGEPGNPFDLDLDVRWDRSVETATISREKSAAGGPGIAVEGDSLRYARTRNALVPRLGIGLWKDLELNVELPYVLGDDREWRYGMELGASTGPGNGIPGNGIDANGNACATTPCPIFSVKGAGYHGGRAGDLKAGLVWGIFNDRKDDTKPFWLVGVDVTAPTSAKWEPGKKRNPTTWDSPYADQKATPGPFGEKIWKVDLYTALSKRYAYVDPYVRAHAQLAFKSASTYSNCDAVTEAAAATPQQMNDLAVTNCKSWGSQADAKLPFVSGFVFGSELIPFEDVLEHQKLSIDLRFFAELTSSQRFYNELSDATGKLLQTGSYMEFGGLLGLYLRASQYVQLQAKASLSTRTAHDLTGEALRNAAGSFNPNFDYRYDAPGRRFRISEVSIFALSVGGVVQF